MFKLYLVINFDNLLNCFASTTSNTYTSFSDSVITLSKLHSEWWDYIKYIHLIFRFSYHIVKAT
jgi:hypothetical protein